MKLSEKLISISQPYLKACLSKPFLIEAYNGTLAIEKFQYYLKVDYPYLLNFNKILALAIFKADHPRLMKTLVDSLQENIKELSLHESYAARFGISPVELSNQQLGPTKYSYTRHELSVAQNGSLIDLLVTMTPCLWGYGELARNMVREYGLVKQSPYAEWINYYLTSEYYQLGEENWQLVDSLTKDCSDDDISRLESSYIKSFYFEVKSWDSYYKMEDWTL